MNARGFLGTTASFTADLSLILGLLVALTLTLGVVMARRRRLQLHRWLQSTAVCLNVVQVGVVMLGSFARSAAPGIPERLGESYFAVAVGHGLLGSATLLFGVFVALRGNELVPGRLRFHNFKLFMRTAYGLYMASTLAGVAVYLIWYAGKPVEISQPVAAAANSQEVLISMANFEFPPEVVVPQGSTVVWLNQDGAPHTATADDGHSFQSDLLSNGQRFSLTATELGEFAYYCELHGSPGGVGMAGTLKVVAADHVAAEPVAAPAPKLAPAALAESAGARSAVAAATQPPAVVVAPPAAPAAPPTVAAAVAPTPAFEHATDAEPRVAAGQPRGLAAWHDDTLANDGLLVSVDDLPTLTGGQTYAAWLSGKDTTLFLGTLAPGRGGAQTLSFASPDHQNLLGAFDRLTIGRATGADASPPSDAVVAGVLPVEALAQVRHLLVGTSATPNEIGFAVGLRQQTDELLRHAQFLNDALAARDLPLEKLHAEHIVNLIEGEQGDHFGDLNGNGKIENPGDGFGLLANGAQAGYIQGMRETAHLAAAAPDATAEIKLHAGHVDIAGENTRIRVEDIRDRALSLLAARSADATRADVQKILALSQQTIQGVDLNGDEQIAPVPGEGGVLVAYQHAQLMAGIPLARPATAASLPAAAPTLTAGGRATAPTLSATLAPAAPSPTVVLTAPTAIPAQAADATLRVAIGDNSFTPQVLTVGVGGSVVWTQGGQKPHTVTADDDSFDSDILRAGATFQQTFATPGTYLYYCDLHGGPGGVGMSARVEVR